MKGQEALSRLRSEIEIMLEEEDIENARHRVAELKQCVEVWKGTSEEVARRKWVHDLEEWVEGEILNMEGVAGGEKGMGENGVTGVRGNEVGRREEMPVRTGSGAGFLRRLREEIYLE